MILRLLVNIIVCFTFALSTSLTSFAFKVDAHIWIAQQVLNDVRDGQISLKFEGSSDLRLPVSQRVVNALRRHPKAFLLGSLGPDAFPDVVSGQMVIHPSVENGWGTSEWMQQLYSDPTLSDEELAFVLGYFTHASSDVFAHTFVNRYAGDLFELNNHEWAAIRHLNIEAFVSNYLPDTVDRQTGRRSNAIGAIGNNPRLWIPEALILRRLLLNDQAMDQMERSGNAPHLVSAYKLHKELSRFTGDDGLLLDIEALALKLVVEATAGIPIAQEQAKKLQEFSNKVNAELNNLSGDIGEFAKKVNTEFGKIEGLQIKVAGKALDEAVSLADRYAKVQIDIARKVLDIQELVNKLQNTPVNVAAKVCNRIKLLKWACKLVDKANPVHIALNLALREARNLLDELDKEREDLKPKIRKAIQEGLDVARSAHETKIALTNQFIAFATDKPFGNKFRNNMETWRDNIPVVLAEFSRANAIAILNSIDPEKPSITDPLKKWLVCYGPGLTAIPVKATAGICIVWNGVEDIRKQFEEFEQKVAELTPITEAIFDVKKKLQDDLEELKDKVFDGVAITVLTEFDKVAKSNSTYIYKALDQPVGFDELNSVMSKDRDGQGLLAIPDAAQRIFAELNVKNGRFDQELFTPARNSVALSKLAMLDGNGLRQLSKLAGVKSSVFGDYLFPDGPPNSQNILFGFVQNIDGNHQWNDLSPPHPRQHGHDETDFTLRANNKDARYGYADDGCSRNLGMRMWADEGAREKLFRKLFKGYIAPGVDVPSKLGGGFGAVLPANYPNLFKSGEWEEDGLTLVAKPASSGTKILKLADNNTAAREIRLFVDDQLLENAYYSADGLMEHTFNIPLKQLGRKLRFEIIGKSNELLGLIHRLIDCNGDMPQASTNLPHEHIVVRGDSLWKISKSIIGDGFKYVDVARLNADIIRNPNLIYPGQTLKLPWNTSISVNIQ